jgi:uncharacterized protein (DUF1778 family)
VSLRARPHLRRALEELAARLTLKTGKRWTLTAVLEEAIELLARREKVRCTE